MPSSSGDRLGVTVGLCFANSLPVDQSESLRVPTVAIVMASGIREVQESRSCMQLRARHCRDLPARLNLGTLGSFLEFGVTLRMQRAVTFALETRGFRNTRIVRLS